MGSKCRWSRFRYQAPVRMCWFGSVRSWSQRSQSSVVSAPKSLVLRAPLSKSHALRALAASAAMAIRNATLTRSLIEQERVQRVQPGVREVRGPGPRADDITWLSLAGDSVMVDATGAVELAAGMTAYFGDFPDVQSEVEIVAVVGAYVHAKETASWSREGVRSSQSSLSTYEIRDGRVKRVWYFPSS